MTTNASTTTYCWICDYYKEQHLAKHHPDHHWGDDLPKEAASVSANENQVGGDHYRKQRIQHWDYVLANEIPYMEAQIIKYVSRWRDKGGLQDLEKAQHFLEKLIEHTKQSSKLTDAAQR